MIVILFLCYVLKNGLVLTKTVTAPDHLQCESAKSLIIADDMKRDPRIVKVAANICMGVQL